MTTKTETTKKDLIAVINEANEKGKTRGSIEGYLQYQYDMSGSDAKELVQEVLGKNETSGADWTEVIAFIRENYGKMDKKELLENMCTIKGAKMSSMNHAYNYIKFAQEFARQEVEAMKK